MPDNGIQVVMFTQSAPLAMVIFQVLRRFWVFSASSNTPEYGRSSCTETGCIQILPMARTVFARPIGDVEYVTSALLDCGLRAPQFDMP